MGLAFGERLLNKHLPEQRQGPGIPDGQVHTQARARTHTDFDVMIGG
jgi:hypothetical protein